MQWEDHSGAPLTFPGLPWSPSPTEPHLGPNFDDNLVKTASAIFSTPLILGTRTPEASIPFICTSCAEPSCPLYGIEDGWIYVDPETCVR